MPDKGKPAAAEHVTAAHLFSRYGRDDTLRACARSLLILCLAIPFAAAPLCGLLILLAYQVGFLEPIIIGGFTWWVHRLERPP